MIWLTWRQFRTAAVTVFGALAALAVILALTGPGVADDWATGIAACVNTSGGCDAFAARFFTDYEGAFLAVTALVLVLPAMIGLFWGAPLVGRELETGTHRLVWNQSVTRSRWLLAKLGLTGLAAMAAGGLGSLAVTWWSSTIDQAALDNFPRLGSPVFDARGVVPIAYSAFAFALGVAIGMLIRRTLPAMAVTLVVFIAIQIVMPVLVRPHLLPATQATIELSRSAVAGLTRSPGGPLHIEGKPSEPGAWLLSAQTVDASGKAVDGITLPPGTCEPPGLSGAASPKQTMGDCLDEINRLGYRLKVTYHAASRFWPFQWMESAIYLALALGVAGFCFWWLRRRLA